MSDQKVTRGHGLLERLLAGRRSAKANKLIPEEHRGGRILDIGCGSFPVFLNNTKFAEKYGLDQLEHYKHEDSFDNEIKITWFDLETSEPIPYEDSFFDVVTMLAVYEHINYSSLVRVLDEIHRILKPNGCLVMTTPAGWTDFMLKTMSRLRLVSTEEIYDHKEIHSHKRIRTVFEMSRFGTSCLRQGYFELFMNLWVRAEKQG